MLKLWNLEGKTLVSKINTKSAILKVSAFGEDSIASLCLESNKSKMIELFSAASDFKLLKSVTNNGCLNIATSPLCFIANYVKKVL